jgi:hypothetical protein
MYAQSTRRNLNTLFGMVLARTLQAKTLPSHFIIHLFTFFSFSSKLDFLDINLQLIRACLLSYCNALQRVRVLRLSETP